MRKKKQFNLAWIIYNDLRIFRKLELCLLAFNMITAILVIIITYKTRGMVMDHEKWLLEIDVLNKEWNHLLVNEKILTNPIRIENIAINELKMDYVDSRLKNRLN